MTVCRTHCGVSEEATRKNWDIFLPVRLRHSYCLKSYLHFVSTAFNTVIIMSQYDDSFAMFR